MKNAIVREQVNIFDLKPGDTILHNGVERTVCQGDLKRNFMGYTVFGDSYCCGSVPVIRLTYQTGNFYIRNKETGLYFSGFDSEGKAEFKGAQCSKPYAQRAEAECQILFLTNCELA